MTGQEHEIVQVLIQQIIHITEQSEDSGQAEWNIFFISNIKILAHEQFL